MSVRIPPLLSRILSSLALITLVALASFFAPWWVFFFIVPLIFLMGYRATAVACALLLDMWWAAPTPWLSHPLVIPFPLTTVVVLLAAAQTVLRRRIMVS